MTGTTRPRGFHGPQFRGARKAARERRKAEAEERDARTPVERTRAFREGRSS